MLREPPAYETVGVLATFERKAGSPFLNCFIVPLLKKFKCQVNSDGLLCCTVGFS